LKSGSKNNHIVALIEQHARFTALIKVSDKETATVVAALVDPLSHRSLLECFGSALSRSRIFGTTPALTFSRVPPDGAGFFELNGRHRAEHQALPGQKRTSGYWLH
jgi:hypothetical protein